MEAGDLARLRRFALASGLILLTYAFAAVELDIGEVIRPLGIPLRIRNPDLLGIGLAAATFYGALRFLYYGVMISETPSARRRRTLAEAGIGKKYVATKTLNVPDENRDALTQQFQAKFPRVLRASVSLSLMDPGGQVRDVEETLGYSPVSVVASLHVPIRIRAGLWFEQIDYTAPIWFNALALVAWLYRILPSWILKWA